MEPCLLDRRGVLLGDGVQDLQRWRLLLDRMLGAFQYVLHFRYAHFELCELGLCFLNRLRGLDVVQLCEGHILFVLPVALKLL